MLGKLMKYELMATGRVFLPMYAALLILSGVSRLLALLPLNTPRTIGIVISVILMVGIMVITFVLMIQRFRSNLLSNEGYLMMTLPVKTDSLILSKMFTSAIWSVASALMVLISIFIMVSSISDFQDWLAMLRNIGWLIPGEPLQSVFLAIEIVIFAALSLFSGPLLIYTCIALSMLVNKRRGLFSFGAYVVITGVLQTLAAVAVAVAAALELGDVTNFSSWSTYTQMHGVVLTMIVAGAAVCAAFYFTTRAMLKNKLNLQ